MARVDLGDLGPIIERLEARGRLVWVTRSTGARSGRRREVGRGRANERTSAVFAHVRASRRRDLTRLWTERGGTRRKSPRPDLRLVHRGLRRRTSSRRRRCSTRRDLDFGYLELAMPASRAAPRRTGSGRTSVSSSPRCAASPRAAAPPPTRSWRCSTAAGATASIRSSPNSRTERRPSYAAEPVEAADRLSSRPSGVADGSRPALVHHRKQDGAGQPADSEPHRDEPDDVPLLTHAHANMPPPPSLPGALRTSRRREVCCSFMNPLCVRSKVGSDRIHRSAARGPNGKSPQSCAVARQDHAPDLRPRIRLAPIQAELADHALGIDRVPLALDLHFVSELAGAAAVPVRSAVTLAAAVERLLALALELHILVPVVGPPRGGPEQHRAEDATGLRPTISHCTAATGSRKPGGPIAPKRFVSSHLNGVILFLAPTAIHRNVPGAGGRCTARETDAKGPSLKTLFLGQGQAQGAL